MRIAKVVSAVAGVLIVLGSLTMVAAGTVVLVVTSDSDGYFTAGPIEVETEASALVADDIDIILDGPMPGGADLDADLVRAKISVESRNGKDVFIGVGPAAAIEDYLGDAVPTYVEVFGDDVVLRTVAVTDSATPPATEDFWVASNEGGSLVWDVDEGQWAVAVLNADGSPGVDVAVTAGIRIPFLRPIGVGVLAAGLIGLIVGILLTYFGVRDERRPPAAAPPPPPGPTESKEPEQATV